MGGIREFCKPDIPQVANLWMRAFHKRNLRAPEALLGYFEGIFFNNPWRDAELPSLVYQRADGAIAGFLGVLPRVLNFNGRPIRVAVPTQLISDEHARHAHVGIKLSRHFMAGKQDLSFCDGANEHSERLCQAVAGETAWLQSLEWTRVLRPAQYIALLLRRRQRLPMLSGAFTPLAEVADAALLKTEWRTYWLTNGAATIVEDGPTDEMLLRCIRQFTHGLTLRPDYDVDAFSWLLKEAAQKKHHGELQRGLVKAKTGEILGWFLFYAKPGDVAQVLQVGAHARSIRLVLEQLAHCAWHRGAVALSGTVDAQFRRALAETGCRVAWRGTYTLVHSRRQDILDAIHRGHAFLSRLEGEWWARFSDPQWHALPPAGQDADASPFPAIATPASDLHPA